jgi:hypothetical protein
LYNDDDADDDCDMEEDDGDTVRHNADGDDASNCAMDGVENTDGTRSMVEQLYCCCCCCSCCSWC